MKLHPPPRKTKVRKREIENRREGSKFLRDVRVTQIRGIGVQFEFPR